MKEPLYSVGEPVFLVTKNGTRERTKVENVFAVNDGFEYQVRARKTPVPEYRLEPIPRPFEDYFVEFTPNEEIGPVEFTPEEITTDLGGFDIEMGLALLFKTGDVVEVTGYDGRRFIVDSYTALISGKTSDIIPELEIEWLLRDEENPDDLTRSIVAYEEDMRKVRARNSQPNITPYSDEKDNEDIPCADENRRLAQLEKYREMYARADRMITDNMSLYAMFGDVRYQRKADRLKSFRDRIPTRGYQFE